ncbi:hypothetical protein HJC23_001569 [Cyclotella cryptica]|uniref:Uncharacterized protein n=1 Tax=Cyclotella cryptica TaxID=29204 RepID=A0ABD3PYM3_9STRA|eukprot:CCRYP_010782-RA/>CCRYP_010782-RA protein AED:0.38 eAED:0.38 QI:0/-1/0/1/-1/1/1/0/97
MNSTVSSLIALLLLSTAQLSSSLLFSPLLLRANPFGVVVARSQDSTRTFKASSEMPQGNSPIAHVDYGQDDDIMRYKYELLEYVYDKSLSRGFENQD